MNLSDIINIVTIIRENSFTRAAKQLYISQSAISQSVAKVERELGVTLFVRGPHQLKVTEAGHAFLKSGSAMMAAYERLRHDMQRLAAQREKHLLIATTSFFFRFISYHNEIIQQQHDPAFDVEIIEDSAANIERMTVNGQVDLCFTRTPLLQTALKHEPLFTETVLLAVPASHPLCAPYAALSYDAFPYIDLSLFRDEPFVMINNPRVTSLCMRMCNDAGFTPNIRLQTGSWEHVNEYVQTGHAVGFISCLHYKSSNQSHNTRYFRIDSPHASLDHVVAYLARESLSDHARRYIDELRKFIHARLPF